MKIPKLQTAWLPIIVSDNTRVTRPVVDYTVERKLLPGEFFYTTKSGNKVVGRSLNATVQLDNRTEHLKQLATKAKVKAEEAEKLKKLDEGAEKLFSLTKLAMPSTYISPLLGLKENDPANLAIDLAAPYALGKGLGYLNKLSYLPKTINVVSKEVPQPLVKFRNNWSDFSLKLTPKKLTGEFTPDLIAYAIRNSRRDAANLYTSLDYYNRAKAAGFSDSEISQLILERLHLLSTDKSRLSLRYDITPPENGHAIGYLDKNGDYYRNVNIFGNNVKNFEDIKDIIGTTDHEFGHVASHGYLSDGRYLKNMSSYVEQKYPMIVKATKYNESILPKLKLSIEELYKTFNRSDIKTKLKSDFPTLSDAELDELVDNFSKLSKHYKEYVATPDETRSRAVASLLASNREGTNVIDYVHSTNPISNARQLHGLFEKESLDNYLNKFLSFGVPAGIFGGTSYVGYNNLQNNDLFTRSSGNFR